MAKKPVTKEKIVIVRDTASRKRNLAFPKKFAKATANLFRNNGKHAACCKGADTA